MGAVMNFLVRCLIAFLKWFGLCSAPLFAFDGLRRTPAGETTVEVAIMALFAVAGAYLLIWKAEAFALKNLPEIDPHNTERATSLSIQSRRPAAYVRGPPSADITEFHARVIARRGTRRGNPAALAAMPRLDCFAPLAMTANCACPPSTRCGRCAWRAKVPG
jgi:hypothetical protein